MNFFFITILSLSLSVLIPASLLAQTTSVQPLSIIPFQGPQTFTPEGKPEVFYQDNHLRLDIYYPRWQAQTKARVLQAYTAAETKQRNTFFSLRFHPASCDLFILKSTLIGTEHYALKTLKQKNVSSKIPQGEHAFYFFSLCDPSPSAQHTVALQLITPKKRLTLKKKNEPFLCKPTQKVSLEIQQHLDHFEAPVDVLSTDMALMMEEAAEHFPHLQFFKYAVPYEPSVYQQDQEIPPSTSSYVNNDEVWKVAKILRKPFDQLPQSTNTTVLQCVTDFQHERLLERIEILRQKSAWLHRLPQSPPIEGLSPFDNLLRHFFFQVNLSHGLNGYYNLTSEDKQ